MVQGFPLILTFTQVTCVQLTQFIWLSRSCAFNCFTFSLQVDAPSAKPYVLRGHDREVTAVTWCPTDPHSIATCGDDATVKLWHLHRPWPPAPRPAPQVHFLEYSLLCHVPAATVLLLRLENVALCPHTCWLCCPSARGPLTLSCCVMCMSFATSALFSSS